MGTQNLEDKRVCSICKQKPRIHWSNFYKRYIVDIKFNRDTKQPLCETCYKRTYINPRQSRYHDKRILNDERILTGFCSCCRNNILDGSCKVTAMAHITYDDSKPLGHRVELCSSCHCQYDGEKRKEHREKRICVDCGSGKTLVRYRNKGYIEDWYSLNKNKKAPWLCNNCYTLRGYHRRNPNAPYIKT